MMSVRQQRLGRQEPNGNGVGALRACLDRSPPKEPVGRLRSSRIDKTPRDREHASDGGTSGLTSVGVRTGARFGARCFGLRTTAQANAGRNDDGCEAAVSA